MTRAAPFVALVTLLEEPPTEAPEVSPHGLHCVELTLREYFSKLIRELGERLLEAKFSALH